MKPPDFEQLAARLVDGLRTDAAAAVAWTRPERPPDTAAPPAVVEALRQVWNARGAADRAAIGEAFEWKGLPLSESGDSVAQIIHALNVTEDRT